MEPSPSPSPSPSLSSSSSLVSKARTAFHSAALKAEKVLTDIKADFKPSDQNPGFISFSLELSVPISVRAIGEESQSGIAAVEGERRRGKIDFGFDDLVRFSMVSLELRFMNVVEAEIGGDVVCVQRLHGCKSPRWKPLGLGSRQEWQDRIKNVRRRKAGGERKDKPLELSSNVLALEEYLDQVKMESSSLKGYEKASHTKMGMRNASKSNSITPAAAVKQLAIAVESGKKHKSMKDFLASSRDSSPIRERGGLSFSVMKSIVLREKEEKSTTDFSDNDEILQLVQLLFDAVRHSPGRTEGAASAISSFPRDIHGAPIGSFVVRLSEIIGSIKTLRKMALFWFKVVGELRRLWYDGQPVPHVPLDDNPDLNSCLLHQEMQVINCCISRKRRHAIASESLNSILREANSNGEDLIIFPSQLSSSSLLYAQVSTGDFILRLGADCQSESLTMLETGEPIYSPITQEGPIITEDFIRETEELVLRTGSVGAGCSQLLSDMQAFKAANPGCILEDFVRWHSPPDWTETDNNVEEDKNVESSDTFDSGDVASRRGNLWRELWETAKPLPALKQTPLYDEDLAVEGILNSFEEISPVFLFRQLFVSLLGSGLAVAEDILPMNDSLIKLFYECKEFVIATCQGDSWIDNVDDLCQIKSFVYEHLLVYKTVERILVNPEDCLRIMKQSEETTGSDDEPKRRFKKLSLNFGVKDRQFLKKPGLFSKKPPKPSNSPQADESSITITDENDWTVV
ncbi:hypothetical protein Sjap_003154 [Stephania japonica]|uniref:Rab3GAP catalytic subunit conserved domain-containing protein n=1 Tax=Stephania japonica TaxID=461633 RepID=A0AAP0KPY7_9MAGN